MDNISDQNLCNIASTLGSRYNDYRGPNIVRMLTSMLPKGSVLDIGCGNGFYMHMLKSSGFDVHGLEPNPEMIKESRIFGSMDIRCGSADDVLRIFRGKSFDNVVMIDVLEHIEDDIKALNDSYKLMKSGGRIAMLVPAYPSLFCKRDRMYGHYRRYSKDDLKSKAEKSGFKILKLRYWAAVTLPIYAAFSRTDFGMEDKYLSIRSGDGICNKMLGLWFRNVENRTNFGFGVNLLCVAEKPGVEQ